MTARRAVVGIVFSCALAISALSAAGASAVPSGYTAFTCANVGGTSGTFVKRHCRKEDAGSGAYRHVGFSGSTAVTGSNVGTATETLTAAPMILQGAIFGVAIKIECRTVSATGTIENSVTGEAMSVVGTMKVKYGECTVTEPSGKGCFISGGGFETEELELKTSGMNLELRPKNPSLNFASIGIEGCVIHAPPEPTYPLRGTLTIPEVEPQGTTLATTEVGVTAAHTIKFVGGTVAGLGATMTLKGPSGAELSFTTPPYTE